MEPNRNKCDNLYMPNEIIIDMYNKHKNYIDRIESGSTHEPSHITFYFYFSTDENIVTQIKNDFRGYSNVTAVFELQN